MGTMLTLMDAIMIAQLLLDSLVLKTSVKDQDALLFVVTEFSTQMRFVMTTIFNQTMAVLLVKLIQVIIAFMKLIDQSVISDPLPRSLSLVRQM